MRRIDSKAVYRILDANFNRSKEALRVLEDATRFFLNNESLTKQYKSVRHDLTDAISSLGIKDLIAAREVEQDVGKGTSLSELKRKKIEDIFLANSQRLKESFRVLEEFSKLISAVSAERFKRLRYKVYELEKKAASTL